MPSVGIAREALVSQTTRPAPRPLCPSQAPSGIDTTEAIATATAVIEQVLAGQLEQAAGLGPGQGVVEPHEGFLDDAGGGGHEALLRSQGVTALPAAQRPRSSTRASTMVASVAVMISAR